MRLTPGSRLGPYEVLSILGTGGMAEVYRARDTRLGRDIALKVVNEALAGDPELVRRFEQEARLAGSLNHPNLVAVYDVGIQDGAAYFITELLKGESLRARLSRGRVPLQTALEWASQLAQGLTAAHGQGIVHRDVKPDNVFVTSDGRVKLLDFGIAKLAEVTREGHHGMLDATVTSTGGGTKTGAILGTPAYMSPEQVRGEPVDARTDTFSLGAVLHEMLSGQRPFPGGSLVETGHAILHDDPPPLPEEVPAAVAQVVRRCLEKEPSRRHQSASDLAFDLELLGGATASMRARPGAPHSTKRVRLLLAIAGTLLVALGVLVYVRARSIGRHALPQIEQVTFREGIILSARFTPEGRFVLSAAWDGQPEEIFSSAPGDVQLQPLGLKDVRLLSVSKSGELAVGMRPQALVRVDKGTLARVPGSGGLPRELSEDVTLADWSPTGELTAVRVVGGSQRIERPLGTPVYEASKEIGDLRISPDGSHVAFVTDSSRGGESEVRVLDAHNAVRILTKSYLECEGLAWSPNGAEVWFTGRDAGGDALRAVSLNGAEREVYRSTGDIKLEDIAADGTVMFRVDDFRGAINLLAKSGVTRRDLSWFGFAVLAALSDDGQLVVFSDSRLTPFGEYVLARRTDGSAPKILGRGHALDLSADQKTVLALTEPGLVLMPVGPGTPQKLATPGLEILDGRFFRSGKRIALVARPIDGRERRLFILEVGSDAAPRPISEIGVSRFPYVIAVSQDERWVAAADSQDVPFVVPVSGGAPIRFPEVMREPDAYPMGWSAAGELWLFSGNSLLRVDIQMHRVLESRELTPRDPTGVHLIWPARVTPDGSAVAFSYSSSRSRLFLMRGAGVPRN